MMTSPERIAKGMWWDRAWSLVEGCSPVGKGCKNCWSARQAHMRARNPNEKIRARYGGLTDADGMWTGEVRFMERDMEKPLRVKKPTTWAIWNDLFSEQVSFYNIDKVFAVMLLAPQHRFVVLTKRAVRMRAYFEARADIWNQMPDTKRFERKA